MILDKFSEILFATSKASDGNMSFAQGDAKEVLKNRQRFFSKLIIDITSIAEVKQVHDNEVILVGDANVKNIEADSLMTNKPEVYLMIKIADCIPIAIYDPKNKAIGLIHAGWQGLDKGVIQNIIDSMSRNFGSKPEDLAVQFGPSIGPCHYKTNLWTLAQNQLEKLGILEKNIDNPRLCTYESKDYFSHRRAENKGEDDFRFVTILGLKNAN